MVLLKNENAVLPLGGVRRLALIGPLADAAAEMQGPWAAASKPEGQVSLLAGIRAALPGTEIRHAPGVDD